MNFSSERKEEMQFDIIETTERLTAIEANLEQTRLDFRAFEAQIENLCKIKKDSRIPEAFEPIIVELNMKRFSAKSDIDYLEKLWFQTSLELDSKEGILVGIDGRRLAAIHSFKFSNNLRIEALMQCRRDAAELLKIERRYQLGRRSQLGIVILPLSEEEERFNREIAATVESARWVLEEEELW